MRMKEFSFPPIEKRSEITTIFPNNFYILRNNNPFIFMGRQGNKIVGQTCLKFCPLFENPVDSYDTLDIQVVSPDDFINKIAINHNQIKGKLYCFPIQKKHYALFPLLHSYNT